MKKIIFISDSLEDPRIQKRLHMFESCGYEIKLFGFTRGANKLSSNKLSYEIIGDIGELPYYKRIIILFKGIKHALKQFREEKNIIFYLFGIQIAIVFQFLSDYPYIYEEADLVHTYLKKSLIKRWLEKKDKKIIISSKLSIFTSEGFIQYHFSNKKPSNCIVLPNKLKPIVQSLNFLGKDHSYNPDNIHFGFVGAVRFEATINFIEHIVRTYPQHVVHLYGIIHSNYLNRINALSKHNNFINHGAFKNPEDLPKVYSSIDFVLSTYDTKYENVRYAEPNKLYESIYFRTPIIVSDNTFLAYKVNKYGSGVSVDAFETEEIDKLIQSLTIDKYNKLIASLNLIDKSSAVDSTEGLEEILKQTTYEV